MKKIIGHIGVDAGLCWIGDPCYVLPDGATDNPGGSWSAFCDALGDEMPTTKNFNGVGVCVSTGYGDGSYPVTADIQDGRVMSVTVNFSDMEEDSWFERMEDDDDDS